MPQGNRSGKHVGLNDDLAPEGPDRDLTEAVARVRGVLDGGSEADVYGAIVREARALFGAEGALVNESVDGIELITVAADGESALTLLRARLAIAASQSGSVAETGIALSLPQAWQNARVWHPPASSEAIGPAMAARLAHLDPWSAVLALYRKPEEPDWSEAELGQLERFCRSTEVFVVFAHAGAEIHGNAAVAGLHADSSELASLVPATGEIRDLMLATEWADTPLGPVASWPRSLRTAVSICMRSRFPFLLWWGTDLVMIYNEAYRPILGISKHPGAMAAKGRDVWPEIWDVIGPMLEGVLAGADATWSEDQLLLLDRNGFPEECYFTFSYSPIVDESQRVGGVFTAVYETTGRVVGDRRLVCLRELARIGFGAQTVAALCDALTTRLADDANDVRFAIVHLGDVDVDSPASSSVRAAAASGTSSIPDVSAIVAEVMADGRPRVVSVPDDDGTTFVTPIADSAGGGPVGVLAVGLAPQRPYDDDFESFLRLVAGQYAASIGAIRSIVSERARAEALVELDRAKTAFFSNVSHEFRTPLTLILGPTGDLLDSDDAAVLRVDRTAVEAVHRNGLRLLRLTNTLLDFSRIEAGRSDGTFVPVEFSMFTAEIAHAFAPTIEAGALRFAIECPPMPELVYVDPDLWDKVVLNLLSNAFKFTLEGSISIRTSATPTHAQLTITDTGSGIPDADLPLLFDRFHRVRGTAARTHEGTGIGLAFVKQIVELHGATIDVESTDGEGTTMTVSLPFGTEHLLPNRIAAPSTPTAPSLGPDSFVSEASAWVGDVPQRPAAEARREPREDSSRPRRILVVEDNADMRAYLVGLLAPHYVVDEAVDGLAGLARLREQRPHVVLTDVMMPGLDGFGLLDAVRADPDLSNTPVLMLSARAGEEAAVEGLGAGADDYLAKPFSANELLARVRSHVELAELRVANAQQARALYEAEHQVALALQQMLLPQQLPEIDGFDIAAEYRPSRRDIEVGGDWYDVIPLDGDQVAVVIGDVVGHDLAAAGAMAHVRNAIRAYAVQDPDPIAVVSALNSFLDQLHDTNFVTVAYLLIDASTGGVRYVLAGHPPPLVVRPDGSSRWLDGGLTAPVGVKAARPVSQAVEVVEPGETLVVYTDGLIERRGESLDDGFAKLERAAASAVAGAFPLMVRSIVDGLGPSHDDIAVLAFRRRLRPA